MDRSVGTAKEEMDAFLKKAIEMRKKDPWIGFSTARPLPSADLMGRHLDYMISDVFPNMKGKEFNADEWAEVTYAIRECNMLQTMYPDNAANEFIPIFAKCIEQYGFNQNGQEFDYLRMYDWACKKGDKLASNEWYAENDPEHNSYPPDFVWADHMAKYFGFSDGKFHNMRVNFDDRLDMLIGNRFSVWTDADTNRINDDIRREYEFIELKARTDTFGQRLDKNQKYMPFDEIDFDATGRGRKARAGYDKAVDDLYRRVYRIDCIDPSVLTDVSVGRKGSVGNFGLTRETRELLGPAYMSFCGEQQAKQISMERYLKNQGENRKAFKQNQNTRGVSTSKSENKMAFRRMPRNADKMSIQEQSNEFDYE